jgi:hypothetical protein
MRHRLEGMQMRPGPALFAAALVPLAVGCTQFPQVKARESAAARAATYPSLLPLADLALPPGAVAPAPVGADARLAALRDRAAGLAGPVLTPEELQALAEALARNPS